MDRVAVEVGPFRRRSHLKGDPLVSSVSISGEQMGSSRRTMVRTAPKPKTLRQRRMS